jgi:acid phosphatase class B
MGISDVDFGISISSLKSIDVEYDDDWLLSQQTKGMESINELVNPWDTDDDNDAAAAAAAAAGNRSVRMMYASEAA